MLIAEITRGRLCIKIFVIQLIDRSNLISGEFHPADINRIKENNNWLKRFLEHTENNVQEALTMLWDTCTWRRKFGANGTSLLN